LAGAYVRKSFGFSIIVGGLFHLKPKIQQTTTQKPFPWDESEGEGNQVTS